MRSTRACRAFHARSARRDLGSCATGARMVIGATNEPPAIPGFVVRAGRDGVVFAVSPRHPLAAVSGALTRTRSARTGPSSSPIRRGARPARVWPARRAGRAGGAVDAREDPRAARRARRRLGAAPARGVARGELVERQTADPREPNLLYVAWHGDRDGRAAMVARAITRTAARAAPARRHRRGRLTRRGTGRNRAFESIRPNMFDDFEHVRHARRTA